MFLLCTLLLCAAAVVSGGSATNDLPATAEQNIIDAMKANNVTKVTRKPIPVYRHIGNGRRLDYYNFEADKTLYIIAFAEEAQSSFFMAGDLPSPLSIMDRAAKTIKETCATYYLLHVDVIFGCQNKKGIWVAATLDESVHRDIKANGTTLDAYIRNHLDEYDSSFDRAKESERDLHDKSVRSHDSISVTPIRPGESREVAIGSGISAIKISYVAVQNDSQTDLANYEKLVCSVITNCVTDGNTSTISTQNIDTSSGVSKLILAIKSDAANTLSGKEAFFSLESTNEDETLVVAFYQIQYSAAGKGWNEYSSWTDRVVYLRNIDHFPQYSYFSYRNSAGQTCYPGSTGIQWAEILGYHDRRAHYYAGYLGQALFGSGYWGTSSPYTPIAPLTRNNDIITNFIVFCALQVQTLCNGVSYGNHVIDILPYWRARTRSTANIQVGNGAYSWVPNFAIVKRGIEEGWPMTWWFRLPSGYFDSRNIIGYRDYYQVYRLCNWTYLGTWRYVSCGSWVTVSYPYVYGQNFTNRSWYTWVSPSIWMPYY